MPKVKLSGLNIRSSRGKWYVSRRSNGQPLVKGFVGTRIQLQKHMESLEFMTAYLEVMDSVVVKRRPEGSLGQIIDWYKRHTVRWSGLKPRTQSDYQKCFDWLGDELDYPAADLVPSDIANVRNKASLDKYPKFADHLVSALSSVFSEALEAGFINANPCAGVKRVYKSKKNSNREWKPHEEKLVFSLAADHILTLLLIAREAGSRGQDIYDFKWSNYDGHYIRYTAKKNNQDMTIPVSSRLKAHLDSLERKSTFIVTTSAGKPYKDLNNMQKSISDLLGKLKRAGDVAPGLTLHGLRVTLASELKRNGEDNRTIADAIGDKSASMGAHYTRHVEQETNIINAFGRRKGVVQK